MAAEDRPVDFEAGQAAAGRFAAAFDIGTTTLAAMLLDPNTPATSGRLCRD